MNLNFYFADHPFEFELILKPNFFKTDMEISRPSLESGWIERVLSVRSISSNADKSLSCNNGGRELSGDLLGSDGSLE